MELLPQPSEPTTTSRYGIWNFAVSFDFGRVSDELFKLPSAVWTEPKFLPHWRGSPPREAVVAVQCVCAQGRTAARGASSGDPVDAVPCEPAVEGCGSAAGHRSPRSERGSQNADNSRREDNWSWSLYE